MNMLDMYELDMAWRARRLADTVKEDISWDVEIEEGGATHSIQVQCLAGMTANIDWGDNTATEATATTLTTISHSYAAGTFTISITGGVYTFQVGAAIADRRRMTTINNANTPGLMSLLRAFGATDFNAVTNAIRDGFRIAPSVVTAEFAFTNMTAIKTLPESMKIPEGITSSYQMFNYCPALTGVPLSFWPSEFTYTGTINFVWMFRFCNGIIGSIAPSHILWDSGNTFSVGRDTFYPNNSTAWLNHAEPYTDPSTGITYSKIPYAWGGAPD